MREEVRRDKYNISYSLFGGMGKGKGGGRDLIKEGVKKRGRVIS